MRILYGKIGRATNLSRTNLSTLGGDIDVLNLLERLATRYPQHEFVLVSRNSGEDPQAVGLPPNVRNVWHGEYADDVREIMLKHKKVSDKMHISYGFVRDEFLTADGIIMWVGQHGTSNIPIPNVGTDWADEVLTKPQDSFLNYVGFLHMGINTWRDEDDGRREEVWLLPDVRNYFKGRDLKWPLRYPMLAQYDKRHQAKFERWRDPRDPWDLNFHAEWEHSVWVTEVRQMYAGVELTAIREVPNSVDGLVLAQGEREAFGMLVNENAKERKPTRLDVLCEWVLPNFPDARLFGTWSEQSQKIMGRRIEALPHGTAMDEMRQWRCTLTTPASGSGWATAKPWEAFLTGTICFFHPQYDTQDHILKDAHPHLRQWLRVDSPEQLKKRVHEVMTNDSTYAWLAAAQWLHLERRFNEDRVGQIIDERMRGWMT